MLTHAIIRSIQASVFLITLSLLLSTTDLHAQVLNKQQRRQLAKDFSKYLDQQSESEEIVGTGFNDSILTFSDAAKVLADSAISMAASSMYVSDSILRYFDLAIHVPGYIHSFSSDGTMSITDSDGKSVFGNIAPLGGSMASATGNGVSIYPDGVKLEGDSKKYFIKEAPVQGVIELSLPRWDNSAEGRSHK